MFCKKWLCSSLALVSAAVLMSGCLEAGVRGKGYKDVPGAREGFATPTTVTVPKMLECVMFAPICVPLALQQNIRALFPKVDPEDARDPVRSTRDDMLKCYKTHAGDTQTPPQWDSLEECENNAFAQWGTGQHIDDDIIEKAQQQNTSVIERAQRGEITPEEALLHWHVIMEMSVVEWDDQGFGREGIDKEWLRDWQNAQCAKTYKGSQAPIPTMRALCRNRVYLGWVRRTNSVNSDTARYVLSDLDPVLKANLDLAREEERTGTHDAVKEEETLASAQNGVEILRSNRAQHAQEVINQQNEEQAWHNSPEYKKQARDKSLAECERQSSAEVRAQCVSSAWSQWGSAMGYHDLTINGLVEGSDRIARQRARGQLSAAQAKHAMALVVENMTKWEHELEQADAARQQRQEEEEAEREQHDRELAQSVANGISEAQQQHSSGFTCQNLGNGQVQCTPN